MDRSKLRTEIAIANRLKTYALTDSLMQLEDLVKQFCKVDTSTKKIEFSDEVENSNEDEESKDYVEILKLRHVNTVK